MAKSEGPAYRWSTTYKNTIETSSFSFQEYIERPRRNCLILCRMASALQDVKYHKQS